MNVELGHVLCLDLVSDNVCAQIWHLIMFVPRFSI